MIVVAGEALYDLVLTDGQTLAAHPGGGPYNTARTIARLDQPVAFLGRISTDRLGSSLLRALDDDGVLTSSLVRTDDPTTLALAEMDGGGVATYRFYTSGTAAGGLAPEEAVSALPEDVMALHLGTLGLVLEPTATALEAVLSTIDERAVVMIDPNVRPGFVADRAAYTARIDRMIGLSDIVKLSDEDAEWLYGTCDPQALLAKGAKVVLITEGAKGASAYTARGRVQVAAPKITVADTVGAGDTFNAGFLASLDRGGWLLAEFDELVLQVRDRFGGLGFGVNFVHSVGASWF